MIIPDGFIRCAAILNNTVYDRSVIQYLALQGVYIYSAI